MGVCGVLTLIIFSSFVMHREAITFTERNNYGSVNKSHKNKTDIDWIKLFPDLVEFVLGIMGVIYTGIQILRYLLPEKSKDVPLIMNEILENGTSEEITSDETDFEWGRTFVQTLILLAFLTGMVMLWIEISIQLLPKKSKN